MASDVVTPGLTQTEGGGGSGGGGKSNQAVLGRVAGVLEELAIVSSIADKINEAVKMAVEEINGAKDTLISDIEVAKGDIEGFVGEAETARNSARIFMVGAGLSSLSAGVSKDSAKAAATRAEDAANRAEAANAGGGATGADTLEHQEPWMTCADNMPC